MKEYNKANIPLAKTLRKNMTSWERKLWYEFLRDYPLRFRRQKAIGNYIADFYCAKAKLVVELDGGGHYTPEQAEKDEARAKELEAMQLKVLRICNLDIDRNFRGVCECIDLAVKGFSPSVGCADTSLVRGRRLRCFPSIGDKKAPSDEGPVTK